MLKKSDIVSIDFNNKWFKKALEYALISWTSTFNRMGKPNPYNRIQKIVLGLIAESAFEAYLIENRIDYETQGKTKWYEEDRYDIGIKSYAADVKANFLDLASPFILNKIENLFTDKYSWLLKCHALVPLDQFNPGDKKSRKHNKNKLYVFPYIEGFFTPNQNSNVLIHALWDYKWLKKGDFKELGNHGKLKITYSGTKNVSSIILYGTQGKNKACIEQVDLNSSQVKTKNDFYQLFSIRWKGQAPDGILNIHSPNLNLSEKIKPENSFLLKAIDDGYWPIENNWQNIILQDCKIHLVGWTYETDMRVIGEKIPRFTHHIEQYSETKVDNWGCLVSELEPMDKLGNIK